MRRHALDPFSLVAGLAFTGIGLVFLLGNAELTVRLRWAWPILLVSLGLGALLKLALPGERREAAAPAGLSDTATAEPWRPTEPLAADTAAHGDDLLTEPGEDPEARTGVLPDVTEGPDPRTGVLPDVAEGTDPRTGVLPDVAEGPDPRTGVLWESGSPEEPGPEPRAGGGGGSR